MGTNDHLSDNLPDDGLEDLELDVEAGAGVTGGNTTTTPPSTVPTKTASTAFSTTVKDGSPTVGGPTPPRTIDRTASTQALARLSAQRRQMPSS